MKKRTIILICVGGVLLLLAVFCISKYNGLVDAEAAVDKKWADVESVYQRRADLIPNLVATVKGYAEHEESTLQTVTDARTRATSITIDPATATPEQMEAWMAAQDELTGALGRLIAVAESYPDLKANENFRDLQAQLEGTENRIAVERQKFNEAVKSYNTAIRKFPTTIYAGWFGFEKKGYFEAQSGAEKAPEVQF